MALPHYPRHDWHRVTLGASGEQVWHLTGPSELFVKIGPSTAAEAARVAWLGGQGIPVAEIVEVGEDFLVTAAVPGRPASDPWPADDRRAVIDAVSGIARRLHALDVATCPFDQTDPADTDRVVCHGDLCLPNVLIDPATHAVTGVIDLARAGVADRYVDLAIATRSIALHPANTQFGPTMARRFLDAYGVSTPDENKIAYYRLLDDQR